MTLPFKDELFLHSFLTFGLIFLFWIMLI